MKNITIKAAWGVIFPMLLLVMIFASSTANAQKMDAETIKKSTPQQRADWQTKMMKEDLKLTDAQYAQVSKLNLEYAQKMQPMLTSDESRLSKGMKLRSIMKEKNEKLKVILTADQYAGYEKIIKEKMEAVKKAFMDK